MHKYYYIILLLSINFCKCLQLPHCPIFINKSINVQKCNKKIIANLDDIIDYHHNKNIIGLMTHILPLFINYNKIEFVISYNKINSLLKKDFTQSPFHKEINTYIIISLGILAKKTNTEITIIYSKFSNFAIDYYMISNLDTDLKIDILKKKSIPLLPQVDPPRINVMNFNKNEIIYHSIPLNISQSRIYNIIYIKDFFA